MVLTEALETVEAKVIETFKCGFASQIALLKGEVAVGSTRDLLELSRNPKGQYELEMSIIPEYDQFFYHGIRVHLHLAELEVNVAKWRAGLITLDGNHGHALVNSKNPIDILNWASTESQKLSALWQYGIRAIKRPGFCKIIQVQALKELYQDVQDSAPHPATAREATPVPSPSLMPVNDHAELVAEDTAPNEAAEESAVVVDLPPCPFDCWDVDGEELQDHDDKDPDILGAGLVPVLDLPVEKENAIVPKCADHEVRQAVQAHNDLSDFERFHQEFGHRPDVCAGFEHDQVPMLTVNYLLPSYSNLEQLSTL